MKFLSMKFLDKRQNNGIEYSLLEQNESLSYKSHGDYTDDESLTSISRNQSQFYPFNVSVICLSILFFRIYASRLLYQ